MIAYRDSGSATWAIPPSPLAEREFNAFQDYIVDFAALVECRDP
jgi:hypothetical protein